MEALLAEDEELALLVITEVMRLAKRESLAFAQPYPSGWAINVIGKPIKRSNVRWALAVQAIADDVGIRIPPEYRIGRLPWLEELQRFTLHIRRDRECWEYDVYEWDRYPAGTPEVGEPRSKTVATFRTLDEAVDRYPTTVIPWNDVVTHSNAIKPLAQACPACGGQYFSMVWHIPLVRICARCHVHILDRTWTVVSYMK